MSHTSRSSRSQMPEAAARALEPRPVTRGESNQQQEPPSAAHVDWVSFSLRPPEGQGLNWLGDELRALCGIDPSTWRETHRGFQGYLAGIDLGGRGMLGYGGAHQRGTICVSINAWGCSLITDWRQLQAFGESVGAQITRVDLAHDDFDATHASVQRAIRWYEEGGFTLNGRPPKRHLEDDFGDGTGKTFYVGRSENGKMARIYEKGKQLGDRTSPWCRVEVQFGSKDRVIPWETLTTPGPWLAGSYPCLATLSPNQSKVKTNQRIKEISYEQMVGNVRHQCGKALNVMLQEHGGDADEVLAKVLRAGKPKRLQRMPGEDDELPALRRERP